MADAVADMLFRFGADITEIKAKMQEVDSRLERFSRKAGRQLSGLRADFKSLREPISNVAQLANSLGNAFGGAASKATGLVNGLVGAFTGGGVFGAGIGIAVGLIATLVSRFKEAETAAKEAAEAETTARAATNKKIQETIDKLDEEIKRRNILLQGKSPTFEAAQEQVSTTEADVEARQREVDARQGEIDNLRGDLARLQEDRRKAQELADRETRGAIGLSFDTRAADLQRQIQDLETQRGAALASLGLAQEAAKKARENLAGSAVADLSTPITPETLTPPGRTSAQNTAEDKGAEAAAAKRKALEEKTARELADQRLALAQGEDGRAIAQYQNRLDVIAGLDTRTSEERAALQEAAFRDLQDRLAQIEAERIERTSGDADNRAKAEKATFEETAAAAKKSADELSAVGIGFASSFVDLLVSPLTEGIDSIGQFAKKAGEFILSLAAELLKAVVLAAVLSALTGGSATALAGVGGLTAVLGKSLGIAGFAQGGRVGSTDTVPAMLTPGEYVMPVDTVQRFGVDFFENLRRAGRFGFSAGGLVGGGGGAGGSVTVFSMSFDEPSIARNTGRLDNVQSRRIDNRQGALLQEKLRRNLRG